MCVMKCKNKAILKKCKMILVRITETETVQPCKMCTRIIKKYGIKKIDCYFINRNNIFI